MDKATLNSWKYTDLREECKRRGLPTQGVKATLVARLAEACASETNPASTEVVETHSKPVEQDRMDQESENTNDQSQALPDGDEKNETSNEQPSENSVVVDEMSSNVGNESTNNVAEELITTVGEESTTNVGEESTTNVGNEPTTKDGNEATTNVAEELTTNVGKEAISNVGDDTTSNDVNESIKDTINEVPSSDVAVAPPQEQLVPEQQPSTEVPRKCESTHDRKRRSRSRSHSHSSRSRSRSRSRSSSSRRRSRRSRSRNRSRSRSRSGRRRSYSRSRSNSPIITSSRRPPVALPSKRSRSRSPRVKSEPTAQSDSALEDIYVNRAKDTPKQWEMRTDVHLDWYNSDLNLIIESSGYKARPISQGGFNFMWAGARANYGISANLLAQSGFRAVAFEVFVSEHLDVNEDVKDVGVPHVVRVGWSVDSPDLTLGECPQSWGYGGTGKKSCNSKFETYGHTFGERDTIATIAELCDDKTLSLSFYVNGKCCGEAYHIDRVTLPGDAVIYPHVLLKNAAIEVNFGQNNSPPKYPLGDRDFKWCMISQLDQQHRTRGPKPPATKEQCEMLMMCGLPGCGKSVWAAKYQQEHLEKRVCVLGSNNILEKMKVMNLRRERNYAGRWEMLVERATRCLNKLIDVASTRNRNYILDQTNVYPTAQQRKMRPFAGFRRKAIVIVPTDEEFKRRIAKRTAEEGKDIPESAVLEMKANFKIPRDGDIFEEVIFPELGREEAEALVAKYNAEGQAAKPPPEKRFRGNNDGGSFNRDGRRSPPSHSRDRDRGNDRGRDRDFGGRREFDDRRGGGQFSRPRDDFRRGSGRDFRGGGRDFRSDSRDFSGGGRGFGNSRDFRSGGSDSDRFNRNMGGRDFGGGSRGFDSHRDSGPGGRDFGGGNRGFRGRDFSGGSNRGFGGGGDRGFGGGGNRSFSGGGDRSFSGGGDRSFSGGGDRGLSGGNQGYGAGSRDFGNKNFMNRDGGSNDRRDQSAGGRDYHSNTGGSNRDPRLNPHGSASAGESRFSRDSGASGFSTSGTERRGNESRFGPRDTGLGAYATTGTTGYRSDANVVQTSQPPTTTRTRRSRFEDAAPTAAQPSANTYSSAAPVSNTSYPAGDAYSSSAYAAPSQYSHSSSNTYSAAATNLPNFSHPPPSMAPNNYQSVPAAAATDYSSYQSAYGSSYPQSNAAYGSNYAAPTTGNYGTPAPTPPAPQYPAPSAAAGWNQYGSYRGY